MSDHKAYRDHVIRAIDWWMLTNRVMLIMMMISISLVDFGGAQAKPGHQPKALSELISAIDQSYHMTREAVSRQQRMAAKTLTAHHPSRWRSIGINAQVQPSQLSNAESGEQQLLATVTLSLGSEHQAQRDLILASERSELTEIKDLALKFRLEAAERYLTLWERRASVILVRDNYKRLEEQVSPSLNSKGLSTLDRLELRALLARQAALADEHELEWDAANAEAIRSIGLVNLSVLESITEESQTFREEDNLEESPWRSMIDQVSEHPTVLKQLRAIEALEMKAKLAAESDPWTAQLGVGVMTVGSARWSMGTLSISKPLSSLAKLNSERLKHLSASRRTERELSLSRLKRSFETHDRHWHSVVARVKRLDQELVTLYRQREEIAYSAYEQRHIQISRWVSAHVERIDAELELIHGQAHLWEAKLKAALISRAINEQEGVLNKVIREGE